FLARARGTQIEYVVLTNSQVRSLDDPNESERTGAPKADAAIGKLGRSQRLEKACTGMRECLSGVRFSSSEVRRTGSSCSRLVIESLLIVASRAADQRHVSRRAR